MCFFKISKQLALHKSVYYKNQRNYHNICSPLYRVDELEFRNKDNNESPFILSPIELIFFRIASIQKPTPINIVKHQGSTRLIGTTSSYDIARSLSKSWEFRNALMEIECAYLKNHVMDVDKIVARVGTGFYTKKPEKEFALCLLPISAVKSAVNIKENRLEINPLYIIPTMRALTNFEKVFTNQLQFLELLYFEGHDISATERQQHLRKIIEQQAEFYASHLSNKNPLSLTVPSYQKSYGSPKSGEQLRDYSPEKTLYDVLIKDGDKIFMKSKFYREIIGGKKRDEYLDKANEDSGYGGYRYSYSFD